VPIQHVVATEGVSMSIDPALLSGFPGMSDLTAEEVRAVIAREGSTWTAGDASISNLSDEQSRPILGAVRGPNDPSLEERQQLALIKSASPPAMAVPAGLALDLPVTYDWRNVDGRNFVTSVKNQDDCGSCTAFGTLATVETCFKVALQDPDFDVDCSDAHLYYRHARRHCETGNVAARGAGRFPRSRRRRRVLLSVCRPQERLRRMWKRLVTADGHRQLAGCVTAALMKIWLTNMRPLIACFTVSQDFKPYTGGVYRHVNGNSVLHRQVAEVRAFSLRNA
jgi:hypothetical protein